MALTQRGINIPVTGQFQDGDDIVDALIAQGLSVDSAIGSIIGQANAYTDTQITARARATVLANGTDLDDVTDPGTYWVGSTIAADPDSHVPVAQGGLLTVTAWIQSTARYCTQLYTRANLTNPQTFVRYRHAVNGWGDWVDLSATYDPTPVLAELSALEDRVAALEAGGLAPLSVSDMVNSWWVKPSALAVGNKVYVTGVGSDGQAAIATYDTATRVTSRIGLGVTAADDHNVPALLVEDDKPPIVAYCGHDQFPNVRVRIGDAPGDVASLGSATEVEVPTGANTSYVLLFRKPGTDTIGMITRLSGGPGVRMFISEDWGETWTAPEDAQLVVSNAYVTMRVSEDGTEAFFGIADHPTTSPNPNIQWARVDLTDGVIYNMAGNVQSTGNLWSWPTPSSPLFPFADTNFVRRDLDADSAYTGWADDRLDGTNTSRLLDVGPGGSVASCRFVRSAPGNGGVYGVYRFRTSGASGSPSLVNPDATQRGWTFEPIVESGVPVGFEASAYVGGMAFGETDDVVYLCREDEGTWTLERWDKIGGTWTHTSTLDTRTNGTKLGRPQVPWHDPSLVTVVHYAHYDVSSYTDFSGRQLLYSVS